MLIGAIGLTTVALAPWTSAQVFAQGCDASQPTCIPQYGGQALVIPPVMPRGERDDDDRDRHISDPTKHDYMYEDAEEGRTKENYKIAVRQFKQQILPAGFPPTTVWSYGPAGDPTPALAPDLTGKSRFNYPAYTVETRDSRRVNVRWINELVGAKTNPIDTNHKFLPHLLPVDQTLHWANPPGPCYEGSSPLTNPKTDCTGGDQTRYNGPVPIVTHVHGAHVDPVSDGYPEAWWLPAAKYIAYTPYATSALHGRLFNDATGENRGNQGYADYSYRNDQAATTLWYHDHALGMTRSNVYAGPAGFWLIRGGKFEGGIDTSKKAPYNKAILPGPAPHRGQTVAALNGDTDIRKAIREIPIAIQDRSFNADGSLFYPASRAFFENLAPDKLLPPPPGSPASPNFAPNTDVNPIWNPEFFGTVMVVNGRSWPELAVAPDRYRFRLLNGTNSRTLNLALFVVDAAGTKIKEIRSRASCPRWCG
jgi:FtsP/CotA-like multicopper oxidase with cupredoxin domain